MATTMYLWFRSTAVADKYKSAVLISGLVTFNDAYRYMDWLLTVPLLLIEILLVMKIPDAEYGGKASALGWSAALMIVSGYYGELIVTGDLTPRWICWFISMIFFLYVVYELLVGLAEATNKEDDPAVKQRIQSAQLITVISWCTYPVVYLFPMLGITAQSAIVSIQIGYCASDIISKCGVGLLIYQITYAKSNKEQGIATYAGKPGMVAKASQGSTPILIFKGITAFTVLTFFYWPLMQN